MSKAPSRAPIVAVSTASRESESGGNTIHVSSQSYLNAVVDVAEAIPLLVPCLGERMDLDWIVARVDGLLLPGGVSNVYPPFYGGVADEKTGPYDIARDETVLPLIRAAVKVGLPILAICRGIQEMNVALGGTLVSDIHEMEGRLDHRSIKDENRDIRYSIRQTVHFNPGSPLAEILGGEVIRTNTLHRQALDRVADGLVVEGVAEDGTVEAVRVAGAPGFAYGVQWHPEYWAATDPASNRLFKAFGDAMRERMTVRLAAAE